MLNLHLALCYDVTSVINISNSLGILIPNRGAVIINNLLIGVVDMKVLHEVLFL